MNAPSEGFERSRGFKVGAGIGALVLTAAGTAWSVVALIFRPGSPAWQFVLVMVPALLLAAVTIRRLVAVAKLQESLSTESERLESARDGRRMGLWFAAIFSAEIALIAGAATTLARADRPLLIPVAVVAIVGAHFVPLARVFKIPTYLVTGVMLMVVAGGSLLISNQSSRLFTLGISSTAILWISAFAVLAVHVGTGSPEKAGLTSTAPDSPPARIGGPMKRVTGIGGIFFKAKDAPALQAWYKRHLGIDVQAWGGAAFDWTDAEGKPVAGTTAWSIDPHDSDHFAPSAAAFMVNYRVEDLHALVKALREEGCNVLDKIDDSDYGKFAWVIDPEGNKVELWQPA
jgi:predicted enzyme related to lactoylglutathione lyase